MFAAAARHLVRRETGSSAIRGAAAIRSMSSLEQYEDYGKAVFHGKVADEYLSKHGGSGDMLKDPTWVNNHADTVANAIFDW